MALIKIPRKLACIFFIFLTILVIQLIISLTFYNITELGDPPSSRQYKTGQPTNHPPSSGENIERSLISKSTGRNYSSPCGVLPKDAIRAINRAKTAKCKKELTEIACLAKKDELYPKEIPNFCPLEKLPLNLVNLPSSNAMSEPIRIAFILSLNNRSFRQILRLFKRIYDSKHFYFIHVDKRRNYLFQELEEHLKGFPNVYFSKNRMSTIWGGVSFLEMLIESMKELLKLSSWDFVINLSESDYPIKPLRKLEEFLGFYKSYNFVRATSQNLKKFVSKQGLDRTFFQCEDRVWRLGPRTIPSGLKISGGSDWFCLTRKFCEYVSHGDDIMLRGVRNLFKYSLLASESFFHTVLQNSHFCGSIVGNNLRLVNWKREKGCKCQYKNVVDWCGCSPNDFTSDDWLRIKETSEKPIFFARKFESIIDQTILNKIDYFLINNETQSLNQDQPNKYWQNEYHDAYDRQLDEKRSFYTILSMMASKMLFLTCKRFHDGDEFLDLNKSLDMHHLLKVTLFFEDDKYHGTLVDYKHMLFENEAPFTFEFLARPITHIKFHQSFENTTVELKVCSDYDSKEEIFRNFGCILNSYTRLAVLHSWTSYSPKNFSITFVWIDSEGILAGSFDVKVSLKSSTSSEKFLHSPNFKHPLKPGAWRLLLFYQWKLIVEEKFLIHPVIFKAGVKLKESEISSLLGGPPDGIYSDHNFTAVEMRLKKNILSSYFKSEEESFSKIKTQNELLNWSLNLISKFWSVNDFCSLSKGVPCNYLDLKPCNSTLWSCHHADSSNLFL